MKPMKPFLLSAALAPALMFAAGSALADDHVDEPDHAGVDAIFLTEQPDNTLHASELTDKDVRSTAEDDEEIGSIDNLLLDEDGQIQALIVSVGGFLGIGDKNVAIEWESVELSQEDDDYVVRVNATRDALEDAEEYESD
ncbi:PRC-barrel domain-containing protein [Franzmannia qiaohouensis]|uniref:PRC-barrel domain-containing protein n=1 Tax=Franzmannia qiaohouensis TaxID=1329370 RepID=A0ABU1HIM9_9GAMM|nr:PRC-barrel domain-containing protein [Halomonas qiaohouensis]MDR5907336.1 PRC-barrel domain-containing protein [Halomonas qiaohouensis]